ncbi:hypothetical protein DFA_06756 [Cavenderia fasciculata]|uniref:PNT domain-containing protein n=1 Tax=Cavenderia fasciculata TaxID=261658 RepID=F4Q269_CACFS|nr:uncharacterized protein DFA_06756 [Cavenderia fasciculata]EGG18089.1 hypothetical protein DFA_06756 [Cavenderia fasciculata]|eukprot:XP_004366130.1 hypothetical protein DFA_06756 [Cavenderia fasciculata]
MSDQATWLNTDPSQWTTKDSTAWLEYFKKDSPAAEEKFDQFKWKGPILLSWSKDTFIEKSAEYGSALYDHLHSRTKVPAPSPQGKTLITISLLFIRLVHTLMMIRQIPSLPFFTI